jgi:hypothetical protein
VRSIQPWKQTKTGTEAPSLTFLRRILQPHPHVPHVQDHPRPQPHRPLRMRRGEEIQTAFATDPIAPGVPRCSPCQSRRRATEQRETSQTAGQRRPDGGLGMEGRRVWRGGAGGDKLIGLSIDLEELHSDSRALEARVDEALAGNQELQSYVQRLDSGLVDEDQEPPTS